MFIPVPWSWYSRWPHNVPFLKPPPTPKVPLAPMVAVIHPPPVTKSHCGVGGGPMLTNGLTTADGEAITTSVTPGQRHVESVHTDAARDRRRLLIKDHQPT